MSDVNRILTLTMQACAEMTPIKGMGHVVRGGSQTNQMCFAALFDGTQEESARCQPLF